MKKICAVLLLSLIALPLAVADDWTAVPPGKARVVVYGDLNAIDTTDLLFQVDDEKPFSYRCSQKNVVLDLAPGRHYIRMTYPMIFGKPLVSDAGFVLAEGNLIYLQYTIAGTGCWLHMVTPTKFEQSAKNRPSIRDPFAGGQL